MHPLNEMSRLFFQQTLDQLEINTVTQVVYPMEVYRGYKVINEKRKEAGMWYSTGQGVHSFAGRIVADGSASTMTFAFSYNDYMRFVDMGVGQGTKYEDVENSKKARFRSRYISNWDRKAGKSQRPAIMMELRHLQKRVGDYLRDFYGYEGEVALLSTFDEISPIKIF